MSTSDNLIRASYALVIGGLSAFAGAGRMHPGGRIVPFFGDVFPTVAVVAAILWSFPYLTRGTLWQKIWAIVTTALAIALFAAVTR